MPPAGVEAVVASAARTGCAPEVGEIPGGIRHMVVVVAGSGMGAGFELSPGGVVTAIVRGGPIGIGIVSQGEHYARNPLYQICSGRGLAAGSAACDVAGGRHDHRGSG